MPTVTPLTITYILAGFAIVFGLALGAWFFAGMIKEEMVRRKIAKDQMRQRAIRLADIV